MVYDEELHIYLKATGLQASDLIKPKVKKKDPRDRSSTSASANQSNRQASPLKTSTTVATNGSGGGLTVAGQQLVQTLMGLQSPANNANNQSVQQVSYSFKDCALNTAAIKINISTLADGVRQ